MNKKSKMKNEHVPHFKQVHFQDKKFEFCVVIPVLNESFRIQNQIKEMIDCGIDQIADIIISDGDSTDGSMDHRFLKSHNINSLLVKKEIGGLSSQLRIGYCFALKRGYKGIVTIDGNNKDSVKSIHDFIELLKNGYDFIQGSRFIEGGEEINTPFVRKYAIKYIHVPIINYLSNYHFTDTTNGFKAYSSNFLNSTKVKPFRRIFKEYDLLYYLTVMAPKLKFKVKEIPVVRSYPSKGPTPTKISPFLGSYLMLKPLFLLLIGYYSKKRDFKDD